MALLEAYKWRARQSFRLPRGVWKSMFYMILREFIFLEERSSMKKIIVSVFLLKFWPLKGKKKPYVQILLYAYSTNIYWALSMYFK